MSRAFGWVAAALVCASPVHAAEKKCTLQRLAEMPVTMSGTRPLISGTINGQPARFLADSGAFFSILSKEAADRYGLRIGPMPRNFRVRGTSGSANMVVGKATKFSLEGFSGGHVFENVDFLVGGNTFARDTAGIIGQNVIGTADAEYDLANGFLRLFRAQECDGKVLAYWAKNQSIAALDFERRTVSEPHFVGEALLNGKKIRIMFDTGAASSVLTLKAAARAGIAPEDEDVTAGGISQGIGRRARENWLGRFDTLDIGGELIKNARLRMADITIGDSVDMLLGADFFLSHRVYIATEDRKIYFTYNGGPVFDLRRPARPASVTAGSEAAAEAEPQEQTAAAPAESIDAGALRRRGIASVSRHDYQAAIADFDRAVQLEPSDPENYLQRGLAKWQSGRPMIAVADFDEALKLEPDHVATLMARGSLRLAAKDKAGAVTDFEAAEKAAPSDSELPLRVARTYVSGGSYEDAVVRYDAWEKKYPRDDRLASVLAERCWALAAANRDLDRALADCDAALRKGARNSAVYDNRALVHLRRRDFDKAIADYNTALKLQPKKASSLHGRGLAHIGKGNKADGDADIVAARENDPRVGDVYNRIGLGTGAATGSE